MTKYLYAKTGHWRYPILAEKRKRFYFSMRLREICRIDFDSLELVWNREGDEPPEDAKLPSVSAETLTGRDIYETLVRTFSQTRRYRQFREQKRKHEAEQKAERQREADRKQDAAEWDAMFERMAEAAKPRRDALTYFGFSEAPNVANLQAEVRRRAIRLHPDRGGDAKAFRVMNHHAGVLLATANAKRAGN